MLDDVEHMKVSEYRQFGDALDAFFKGHSADHLVRHAIFGAAGVVERECCALTNNPWIVAADELRGRFDFSAIHVVNDFEALAWSLPHLTAKDLRLIGGQKPNTAAPMVVLGPGTGLGVAAYVHGKRGDFVLHSEGGHATLPGASSREDAIIANLRGQFGHVSAERVLSGPGLENLYRVIASLDSQTVAQRTAAQITKAALANRCAVSRAALDTFCGLLGSVAGNLA
jgi:glucokinase